MKWIIVRIWILASTFCWLAGTLWRWADEGSALAFLLGFSGWVSFLLALGFYCTPSSLPGKIAFGFVAVMVTGIAFKILHFEKGNTMIITGLIGLLISYRWIGLIQKK